MTVLSKRVHTFGRATLERHGERVHKIALACREDPDTLFFSRRLVSEGDIELGLIVKNLLDAIDPESASPAAHTAGARGTTF